MRLDFLLVSMHMPATNGFALIPSFRRGATTLSLHQFLMHVSEVTSLDAFIVLTVKLFGFAKVYMLSTDHLPCPQPY